MNDDDLLDVLGDFDPTVEDPAPAPGSPRYDQILEHAMTLSLSPTPALDRPSAPAIARRRLPRLVAAAAAITLVAVGATLLRPGATPSAEAAIEAAADSLDGVTSLRATMVITGADGTVEERLTGEFVGDDARIVSESGDGSTDSTMTVVGDEVWVESGGEVTREVRTANDHLTPFAQASALVIDAALTGADIEDLGRIELDGVTVDRYRLAMTPESRSALGALTPQDLAWFELEYPDAVDAIEVWVGDGLVRGITVDGRDDVREMRFADFDAAITIDAPTG